MLLTIEWLLNDANVGKIRLASRYLDPAADRPCLSGRSGPENAAHCARRMAIPRGAPWTTTARRL